jgi:hypothetical protein
MGFADRYIAKNRGAFFFEPTKILPLRIIVVIPCFNEPEIGYTLSSLLECDNPGVETGIVVVVNSTENSTEEVLNQNRKTITELKNLSEEVELGFHLFVIEVENLPQKHGGVGWSRKIGMDWAVVQFNHFDNNDGIILSLDADSRVEKNYLTSIYNYLNRYPDKFAATFYFEHTFHPSDFRSENLERASVLYELYMRFYRNALSFIGFPNSIYTIGSCFAVRAEAYVAQGGMNRRKAGEDFYFLQKMALLGEINEISTTTVYPSSRLSSRVPFGTGPSLQKFCDGDQSLEYTFSLGAFEVLRCFFSNIEIYYERSDKLLAEDFSDNTSFIHFCNEIKLTEEIHELSANCGSFAIFKKRFFHVFNAFRVLKWMNYSLLNGFPKTSLLIESYKLLRLKGIEDDIIPADPGQMLTLFRSSDKCRTKN